VVHDYFFSLRGIPQSAIAVSRSKTGESALLGLLVSLGLLIFGAGSSAAEDPWSLCKAFEIPTLPLRESAAGDQQAGAIQITADAVELNTEGVSTLRGAVQVHSDGRFLQSDMVGYIKSSEVIYTTEDLHYWEEDLYVSGKSGSVALASDTAQIEGADFLLKGRHARGWAARMTLQGSELLTVEKGAYTTCDQNQDSWLLRAEKIRLNLVTDVGTARNVTLRFQGVPIFYSPFLTFPLSTERKSGFLAPTFGLSGENGTEISIPYYWNIAPNQDATLTGRAMQERGKDNSAWNTCPTM
jgi:LPS-assembly protein